MKTIVIIPSRMASQRFPNKPMAMINGMTMIERVWKQAINSNVGNVYVACCEKEVFELITDKGGNAIMTDPNLPSGTDRVFAGFEKIQNLEKLDSIINLQGDMPLINSDDIAKVNEPIINGYSIGTLGTDLNSIEEENINITKVKINWDKEKKIGDAVDFYKNSKGTLKNIYQHVGIYSFKPSALNNFVKLSQSKNELEKKLEQLRAIDAGIKIGISYVENVPLSVDTKEDLNHIESIIKGTNDKY